MKNVNYEKITQYYYDATCDLITKFRYVIYDDVNKRIIGRSHSERNADIVQHRKGGTVVDLLRQNWATESDYRDRIHSAADIGDIETINEIESSTYYIRLNEISELFRKQFLKQLS